MLEFNYNMDEMPIGEDVLLKLSDGSLAVGCKDGYGYIEPANVHQTYDGCGGVVFDAKPIGWVLCESLLWVP